MSKKGKLLNKKSGISLIWVMLLSSLLILLATIMLTITTAESRMTLRVDNSAKAIAAAESGIAWAKSYLRDYKATIDPDNNIIPPGIIELGDPGSSMKIADPDDPEKELSHYTVKITDSDGLALKSTNFDANPNNPTFGMLQTAMITSTGVSDGAQRKLVYNYDATGVSEEASACSLIDIDNTVTVKNIGDSGKYVTEFLIGASDTSKKLDIGFTRNGLVPTNTSPTNGGLLISKSAGGAAFSLKYYSGVEGEEEVESAKIDIVPATSLVAFSPYRVILTYRQGLGVELNITTSANVCIQSTSIMTADLGTFEMIGSKFYATTAVNGDKEVIARDIQHVSEDIMKVKIGNYILSSLYTLGYIFDTTATTASCGGLRVATAWNPTTGKMNYVAIQPNGVTYSAVENIGWTRINDTGISEVDDLISITAAWDGMKVTYIATRPNGETYLSGLQTPLVWTKRVAALASNIDDTEIVSTASFADGSGLVRYIAVRATGETYYSDSESVTATSPPDPPSTTATWIKILNQVISPVNVSAYIVSISGGFNGVDRYHFVAVNKTGYLYYSSLTKDTTPGTTNYSADPYWLGPSTGNLSSAVSVTAGWNSGALDYYITSESGLTKKNRQIGQTSYPSGSAASTEIQNPGSPLTGTPPLGNIVSVAGTMANGVFHFISTLEHGKSYRFPSEPAGYVWQSLNLTNTGM